MRQLAGFGTGEDTNRRFRYLIENGQTALSVVFDMPTLMGYDSDHPLAAGEVGREGAAVDTIDDMAALFAGIDLTRTSVSMTINPTASSCSRCTSPWRRIGGTTWTIFPGPPRRTSSRSTWRRRSGSIPSGPACGSCGT